MAMAASAGGFLHWRKERYLMDDAIAIWDGKRLSVYGKSNECGIFFSGIPFGAAANLKDIKGKAYSGERDTPFSEGRLAIGDEPFCMMSGEITCIGVSPSEDSVALEFEVAVENGIGGTRRL